MENILEKFKYLENQPFCFIYMTVIDIKTEKVKLTPVYGTAKILSDRLILEEDSTKEQHTVPTSALSSILPSDGNELLKNARYYVIVKIAEM